MNVKITLCASWVTLALMIELISLHPDDVNQTLNRLRAIGYYCNFQFWNSIVIEGHRTRSDAKFAIETILKFTQNFDVRLSFDCVRQSNFNWPIAFDLVRLIRNWIPFDWHNLVTWIVQESRTVSALRLKTQVWKNTYSSPFFYFLQLALILPTQENYLSAIVNNNRLHVVDFMKVWGLIIQKFWGLKNSLIYACTKQAQNDKFSSMVMVLTYCSRVDELIEAINHTPRLCVLK